VPSLKKPGYEDSPLPSRDICRHIFVMSRTFMSEDIPNDDLPNRPISKHPTTLPSRIWR
jgi:hypothetical protein